VIYIKAKFFVRSIGGERFLPSAAIATNNDYIMYIFNVGKITAKFVTNSQPRAEK